MGYPGESTSAPKQRMYLPTLAELVDRLAIVQLKSIFLSENKPAYDEEIKLIEHDISLLMKQLFDRGRHFSGQDIRAILIIAISNRWIWENESKARQGSSEQNQYLRGTHAVNGIRNTAKNVLSRNTGERLDLKIDCLSADLPEDMGNWRVFDETT